MRRRPAGPPLVLMVCRGIGDVIWHLPSFRAIAAHSPQGKVALAMRPSTLARDLLRADPCISHVVDLPQAPPSPKLLPSYISIFRRERPCSIWVMERATIPSMAAFLAGIPERRGYGMKSRWQEIWLNAHPRLPRDTRKLHRLEKLDAFDRLHGFETSREVSLHLDEAVRKAIAARLAGLPRPWVVFGVGASEPWRLWPINRYADVAARLRDRLGTVFWFGGPGDAEPVRAELAGRTDQPNSVMWFNHSMHEGAVLMSLADVFMGPDSGPMNVAAAAGTVALGLYGPSEPLTYSRRLRAVVSPDATMAGLSVEQAAGSLAGFLQSDRKAL